MAGREHSHFVDKIKALLPPDPAVHELYNNIPDAGVGPDEIVLPSSMSHTSLRILLGNMVCVTKIGTVEALVLLCFMPDLVGWQ